MSVHSKAAASREHFADTPGFDRWFAGSKVVDEQLRPLVVYHGTTRSVNPGEREQGHGIWFASDPSVASTYAIARGEFAAEGGENPEPQVQPVYLSIKNPLVVDARGARYDEIEIGNINWETDSLLIEARERGHDGLVVRNVRDLAGVVEDDEAVDTVYAVFRPEQVKSAIGNCGQFDPANPDIRCSQALRERIAGGPVPGAAAPERADRRAPAAPSQDSPEFRRWFGSSKVVDGSGRPLVVYHGTSRDFTEFDLGRAFDGGLYFSGSPKNASQYARMAARHGGEVVYPSYLSITNPIEIDHDGLPFTEELQDRLADAIAEAEATGKDGVIVRRVADHGDDEVSDMFIALRPEQIKSAIGNCGTFDGSSPDIRCCLRSIAEPDDSPVRERQR